MGSARYFGYESRCAGKGVDVRESNEPEIFSLIAPVAGATAGVRLVACRAEEVEEIRSLGHPASWRRELVARHTSGASNGPTRVLNCS